MAATVLTGKGPEEQYSKQMPCSVPVGRGHDGLPSGFSLCPQSSRPCLEPGPILLFKRKMF